MFDEENYLEVARGRYTDQFKESPNFDYLMMIWLMGYEEIQETFINLLDIKDVDKAYGSQLDVIGNIVGQPRTLEDIDSTGFFGFSEDSAALSFGSVSNSAGGLYVSVNQETTTGYVELPDSLYRYFIKAKISSNNAGGTPEEVISSAMSLFSTETVELLDGGSESGVMSLYIGRPWNDEELSSFPGLDETDIANRLLPKPAGVRIDFVDVAIVPTLLAVDRYEAAANRLYYVANTDTYQKLGMTDEEVAKDVVLTSIHYGADAERFNTFVNYDLYQTIGDDKF